MKKSIIILSTFLIFYFIFFSLNPCDAQSPKSKNTQKTKPAKVISLRKDSIKTKNTNELEQMLIEKDIRFYKQKVPTSLKKLKNKNYEKRLIAIEFLGKSRDLKALNPLIAVLKTDSIPQVRAEAIAASGMISKYHRKNEMIPVFIKALEDSSVRVKLSASQTLLMLGELKAQIQTLKSIFYRDCPIFRKPVDVWIIEKEIHRPDFSIQKQLELARRAKSGWPRAALRSLTKIGTEEVKAFLIQSLQSNDLWIQKEAQKALNEFE